MATSRTVQFKTVIGTAGVLRQPEGLTLPEGQVLVTVSQLAEDRTEDQSPVSPPKWGWLLDLADEVEHLPLNLPKDMAENHDHYSHQKTGIPMDVTPRSL